MEKPWRSRSGAISVAAAVYLAVVALGGIQGQAKGGSGGGSGKGGGGDAGAFLLTGVVPPDPGNLARYVRDRDVAVVLGKALFWDVQVGSDGATACASCHFSAGVDNRVKNTFNPGKNGVFSAGHGPNSVATAATFPLRKLADPNNRSSAVLRDSDDVVGSQGVFNRNFLSVGSLAEDSCTDTPDPVFHVGSLNVRRVTGRQAPTNINAVFNFRNFWDGRARENFNGANPGGQTDPNARIYRNIGGVLTPVSELIANASAASQATGPVLSSTEMSCAGRIWPNVGRKMLGLIPLDRQKVSSNDSVLGLHVNSNGRGLSTSYARLIQQAFLPELWESAETVAIGADSFSQIEANFSLFWGLAIQLYEATLISDDAPLDRFARGDASALTAQQQQGLSLFQGEGRCEHCHKGPTLTVATGPNERAFVNTGVRPSAEDSGDVVLGGGRFKTAGLRNVELTGPYFHNGGYATLRQVVDFYNRGGDFPEPTTDSQIRELGLTSAQKDALVAFLLSLTDDRVRHYRAPFDHPELCVPEGEKGSSTSVQADGSSIRAADVITCLAAVGAAGVSTPIKTFLGLSPFQP